MIEQVSDQAKDQTTALKADLDQAMALQVDQDRMVAHDQASLDISHSYSGHQIVKLFSKSRKRESDITISRKFIIYDILKIGGVYKAGFEGWLSAAMPQAGNRSMYVEQIHKWRALNVTRGRYSTDAKSANNSSTSISFLSIYGKSGWYPSVCISLRPSSSFSSSVLSYSSIVI